MPVVWRTCSRTQARQSSSAPSRSHPDIATDRAGRRVGRCTTSSIRDPPPVQTNVRPMSSAHPRSFSSRATAAPLNGQKNGPPPLQGGVLRLLSVTVDQCFRNDPTGCLRDHDTTRPRDVCSDVNPVLASRVRVRTLESPDRARYAMLVLGLPPIMRTLSCRCLGAKPLTPPRASPPCAAPSCPSRYPPSPDTTPVKVGSLRRQRVNIPNLRSSDFGSMRGGGPADAPDSDVAYTTPSSFAAVER